TMRVGNRLGDGLGITRAAQSGNRSGPGQLGKANTLDEIHGEKRPSIMFTKFVNGNDVRVPQTCYRLRFSFKARSDFRRLRTSIAEHQLHRDGTAKAGLPRPVYDPHPASANEFEQFVTEEPARETFIQN